MPDTPDDGDNPYVSGLANMMQGIETQEDATLAAAREAQRKSAEVKNLDEERKRRETEGLRGRRQRGAKERLAAMPESALKQALEGKPFKPLPDDCPVQPLGKTPTGEYAFIDAIGMYAEKTPERMTQSGVDDLICTEASQRWAEIEYGKYDQMGRLGGIDRDRLRRALMTKCGERGIFDPLNKLRGVGAWRGPEGRLLWHMGNGLAAFDKDGLMILNPTGRSHDGMVYPLGVVQPMPAPAEESGPSYLSNMGYWEGPVGELLQLFCQWPWKRPELDPRLMLGCVGAAIVGGALRWRPNSWLCGDYASGKSELQSVLHAVMGGDASVVHSSDATGAGIWQALKSRSLPVVLDEVEAKTDNTKREAIIELARLSAGGGRLTRGGSDHKVVEFIARSCFFFASINRISMPSQDLSRLVLLDLNKIPDGSKKPETNPEDLMRYGQSIRRRIIDRWSRFEGELLRPWYDYLNARIGGRSADVYATALAMQHLLLFDHVATASEVEELAAAIVADVSAVKAATGSDHDQAVAYLASQPLEAGEKRIKYSVVGLVEVAAELREEEQRRDVMAKTPADERAVMPDRGLSRSDAQGALARHGMRVVDPKDGGRYLALQTTGSAVNRLFKETHWKGGVWAQSLGRVPGVLRKAQRIEGPPVWCLLLPLEVLTGDSGPPPQETADQAADPVEEPL